PALKIPTHTGGDPSDHLVVLMSSGPEHSDSCRGQRCSGGTGLTEFNRIGDWTMTAEMLTKRNVLFSLGSRIVCLLLAGAGQASVPKAFVSTQGSDKDPCTSLKPCRTFNQALAVVDVGGEIVALDSGDYSSGFTITKSVTINAGGTD